jgi:hypothetical protein
MSERVGGIVVRRGDALGFVPAEVARRVVQRPVVSRVPGTDIGLALIAGRVIAVVAVAPERSTAPELVVCDIGTDLVALSGLEVVEAGTYDREGDVVVLHGQPVPLFDVAAEVLRVESELVAARARPSRGNR